MSTVQLRRVDPNRNMARFYMLTVQPSLFGEWCLVREWGRIGSPGRVASTAFPFPALAEAALDKCQRQKVLRGYSQPYKAEQERGLSRACQYGATICVRKCVNQDEKL